MTKDELIAFEKEVARHYEAGEIHSPVHLSGGNEDALIKIFKSIRPIDWVLSSWRNHYHALLHGIPPDELMRQILAGRSMYINSIKPWFYASSIVGGILPIAVGLGLGIKRKGEDRRVFAFIGEMTAECGIFYESVKYAENFELPVTFIIESNGKSVSTVTAEAWGRETESFPYKNIIRYEYELTWPHSGVGRFIAF
jgi:TPP-dependent pyruvate/acetoin dehydrogenase alpha subunit